MRRHVNGHGGNVMYSIVKPAGNLRSDAPAHDMRGERGFAPVVQARRHAGSRVLSIVVPLPASAWPSAGRS
ncbi:hypothetical protein BN2475_190069 [Paraburkholderia ribeironis]|uniref:Uncharacterized protein n=1 Tax=Paraburkholderia ribeironis TaxID=1247936 RepID=A0A1N7RVI0_9BURK|nr:hypothetical protein BN2475_190069 [Paraburkholderia ribeironis]